MTAGANPLDSVFEPPRVNRSLGRLRKLIGDAIGIVWSAAPRPFAATVVLQVLGALGLFAQLAITRVLIGRVLDLEDGSSVAPIVPWLLGFGGVTVLVAFSGVARTELQRLLSEEVARFAQSRVVRAATRAELIEFESPAFHDRIERASVNAMIRPVQMVGGTMGLLSATLSLVAIAVTIGAVTPLLLPIMLIGYAPLGLLAVKTSRLEHRTAVEVTEGDRRRQHLEDMLMSRGAAGEVRAYGLGEFFLGRIGDLYRERIDRVTTLVRRRLVFGLVGAAISSAVTVLTASVMTAAIAGGTLSGAAAGLLLGTLLVLGQRLTMLAAAVNALFESALFLEDFTGFVGADLSPVMRDGPVVEPADRGPPAIVVDGASFTYPAQTSPALEAISLEVRPGEVLAIVGENGSGKSTLAKLLVGLYEPDAGTVRWPTTHGGERPRADVLDDTAMLFQDVARFNLDVWENIGVGRLQRLDDRRAIEAAADRAGVDDVVRHLPRGYETALGVDFARGAELSVGQWQRVALARAFFRDASLLVLDEPSASLDPRAEAQMFEQVQELYRGRTVILISHRLSNVRSADRICVIDRGRLVEQGSHAELMDRGGLYAELFRLQASGYGDDD
ncbi:MAG: ABC transporter ATP-binding protein [Actinomycetes bacterium]